MKIPTQVYKPENFEKEVSDIKAITVSRYNYSHERYELIDRDNNAYDIDYSDGTITIN